MKKKLFVVSLCISIIFLGCGCGASNAKSNVEISIGYQPTIFYSYLFIADYFKMFEKSGIDVKYIKFTSANKMYQAFLAGQLDITGLTATEIMLRGYEKDPNLFLSPLYVELNNNYIVDHIIVKEDSPISSLMDLKGMKIGSHPGTTVPNVLSELLLKYNIKPEEYYIQELKPELQVDALLSGSVDAIICLEPTGTRLLMTSECRILYNNPFSIIAKSVPASFALVSGDLIDANNKKVDKLVDIFDKAVDKYYELYDSDKDKLAEILTKYINMKDNEIKEVPMVVYRKNDSWNNEDLKKVEQFYIRNKVLSKSFGIDNIKYHKK